MIKLVLLLDKQQQNKSSTYHINSSLNNNFLFDSRKRLNICKHSSVSISKNPK